MSVTSKQDTEGFRNQRLRFALIWSIASKASAFLVQIVAIPVAIHYCGIGTYTLFLSLVAASMAPTILLARMGPRFIGKVSAAYHGNHTPKIAAYFRDGLKLTYVGCSLSIILVLVLANTSILNSAFQDFSASSFVGPFAILCCANVIAGVFQSLESMQSGLHETHLVYTRSTITNVIAFVLLFILTPIYPNILTLILILRILPLIARTINAAIFIARRRSLFCGDPNPDHSFRANVYTDSIRFTFVAGFCAYCGLQAPLLILATQSSEMAVASALALAMQIVMQLLGVANVLILPSIPAMADAHASNDEESVYRLQHKITATILAMGVLSCVAGIAAGIFFAGQLELSTMSAAIILGSAGAFFAVTAAEQSLFTFILAVADQSSASMSYVVMASKSIAILIVTIMAVWMQIEVYSLAAVSITVCFVSLIPLRLIQHQSSKVSNREGLI